MKGLKTLFGILALIFAFHAHAQNEGRVTESLTESSLESCAAFVAPPGSAQEQLKVVSLFAGSGQIESRLAKTLGITIDAIDIKAPQEFPAGVRFIQADLTGSKRAQEQPYDRVLLISPWIRPKIIRLLNGSPIEIPFSPRINSVVASAADRLLDFVNDPRGGLSTAKVIVGPSLSTEGRDVYLDRELLKERLGQLYEAVALAKDRLKPDGKLLLLTELIHTLPLSQRVTHSNILNYLLDWPMHKTVALEMLRSGFPGISIENSPQYLKEALLGKDGSSDNPWGTEALDGWVISFSSPRTVFIP